MKRIIMYGMMLFIAASCQKEVTNIQSAPIVDSSSNPSFNSSEVLMMAESNTTEFSGLITAMKAKNTKISICLVGDSTGNEDVEWFFKFVKWLLSVFPAYVVEYHIWNSTLDNYSSTVRIIKGTAATTSSPVLIVYNGSRPGATIELLSNYDRLKRFIPANVNYKSILLSCSHNDGAETGSTYISKWRNWKKSIRTITTKGQIIITTQNPKIYPASYINQHATRRSNLLTFGTTDSIPVIDAYKAFYDSSTPLSGLIKTDGIHPNTTGSQVWADKVISIAKRNL